MPKAKPTQVIVHRIELQEKEREFLEALQTTQSIKNVAFAGAGVLVAGVSYLGWKTYHESKTGEEPGLLNILTKEGRANFKNKVKEDPEGTFWSIFFDPTGLNPLI